MLKTGIIGEDAKLARKYRPLLVLYPEIADGSHRADNHRSIRERPASAPLLQDYHPRDIRLVLDHVHLRGRNGRPSREQVLDAMSRNDVEHVDLIDRGGPQEVDKFWEVYASVADKDNHPEYRRKAYARVVRGNRWFEDYTSIQYWMAYFFDDWANVHEMDWEMVSVIVKGEYPAERPVACIFNAHIGAFRKPWADVQKADGQGKRSNSGRHPVAYIANGSHAAYFSEYPPYFNVATPYLNDMLRTVVRVAGIARPFTDYVPRFEEGVRCFPDVDVIPEPGASGRWEGDWRWLNFRGRWGSPVDLSLGERIVAVIPLVRRFPVFFQRPLRAGGPPGPNTRGCCWEAPFDYANLECFEAPATQPWLDRVSRA